MLKKDHQHCYAAGPKARISNAKRTKQHLWQKSFPTCVLATLTPAVLTCPQLRPCGKLRKPPKKYSTKTIQFCCKLQHVLQKKTNETKSHLECFIFSIRAGICCCEKEYQHSKGVNTLSSIIMQEERMETIHGLGIKKRLQQLNLRGKMTSEKYLLIKKVLKEL